METTAKRASGSIRRKQIKKATLEIISEEGLKKLSTKNLAHHVHLSEGTIFRHFTSKKAIILSILDDVKQTLLLPLQKIVEQSVPANKKLHEFICFHLNYLREHDGVTILLFTEATYQNDVILKKKLNNFFRYIQQYFERIIQEGIADKLWDYTLPVEVISSLYMGIPITKSIEMKLSPEAFSNQKFCLQMSNLIFRLLIIPIHKNRKIFT